MHLAVFKVHLLHAGSSDFRRSPIFHDGGPYHIETSPLICRANRDTDLRHERVYDIEGYDKLNEIITSSHQLESYKCFLKEAFKDLKK